MSKSKIEAIYPLTFMQQALLFHHIHEQNDQGFLQVQCTLEGRLDPRLLEKAFANTVKRHQFLRISIHWENIKKPVQIVHPDAVMPFAHHDWRSNEPEQQIEKLQSLKDADRQRGFDFAAAPLSALSLLRLKDDTHVLLWNCHHILLDGWSAAVILRDAFHFYDALCKGKEASVAALPDYKTYLNWLQRQDPDGPRIFWQQAMAGFNKPALLATEMSDVKRAVNQFREVTYPLSEKTAAEVRTYARRHHLTLSTICQGLWALLLGRFVERRDVVIGITVSGRSAPIPNLEQVTGLFTNVLPARIRIPESTSVSDWLINLQREQIAARNTEYITLDQIVAWTGWPGHLPLFDSLLVVENFPWSELQGGDVVLKDFTGGFTSTYPVTVVVKPGIQLEIVLRHQTGRIPERLADLLLAGLQSLFESLGETDPGVSDLWQRIDEGANKLAIKTSSVNGRNGKKHLVNRSYTSARNTTELKLTRIWEEILGRHPIGIRDDFFQVGGTSVQAVRLFTQIEKKFQRSLPPATLMQNRTIESLALLLKEDHVQTWNSLVPIRAGGSKTPLFCVHAGGAHVLFYHRLAHHMGADQPVYALQPAGLDGQAALHKSVEEMAACYIHEIRKVQPEGPYAFLGTCFGNAVCLEMARQFQAAGQAISLLAIIDSGVYSPEEAIGPTSAAELKRIPLRYHRFINRFRKNAFKAILAIFKARFTRLRIAMEKRFNFLRSRQTRSLYSVQKHLLKLHLQYGWTPYNGKVTLIRSSESTENPNLDCHISQWSKLAIKGVEVFIVPGHHETLFLEPEVAILSAKLNEILRVSREKKIITVDV